MDQQRVNLDGFAIEDPELGLTALRSPHDPEPSLVVADGRLLVASRPSLPASRPSRTRDHSVPARTPGATGWHPRKRQRCSIVVAGAASMLHRRARPGPGMMPP